MEKGFYKIPWEEHSIKGKGIYNTYYGRPTKETLYNFTIDYLKDNHRLKYRKGDIIQFKDAYKIVTDQSWQEWFMTRKHLRKNYSQKIYNIPENTSLCKGIILGRYRKVKYKYAKFMDYGNIIMVLSGKKKGCIKYYYMNYPFTVFLPFSQVIEDRKNVRKVPKLIRDLFSKEYEDTDSSRNLFVSQVCQRLNLEKYNEYTRSVR